jgi:23S rRNA pseudouridine1911/1915/1917 synthase
MSATDQQSPALDHLLFDAAEHHVGRRLDLVLVDQMDSMSRSRLQSLIRKGFVCLDGAVVRDPGHKVKSSQSIEVRVPPPEPVEAEPEPMSLDVVFEDDALIVIDKPAGLVVHPAPGHRSGTLVNALLAHCGDSLSGIGGIRRPGIVHRLDKDTSGLLVVAKTDAAHKGLSAQFKSHGRDGKLQRRYVALVWGAFDRPTGTISAAIGRSRANRQKMAVVRDDSGREAITHYQVDATFRDIEGKTIASRVLVELETGRTHQIRVHMADNGHPLLGDAVYGGGFKTRAKRLDEGQQEALQSLGRQALHAATLGFEHPVTGVAMAFESDLPADMRRLVSVLAP